MAELVTRLRVDSSDYDNKIQRATKGLQAYQDKCRELGGTLEYVEKDELAFVRSLGNMETVAHSSKGKLNELKQSFVELSTQYKNLTDAEKNSPFGKALAGSIDQLKGRFSTLNSQVKASEHEIGGSGGGLSQAVQVLGSKLGISTKAFSKLGLAAGAVGAVVKVAGDVFKANKENVDKLNRTMEASHAVYKSFCNALSSGDLGGFFKNIGRVIRSANDVYNALDKLNTFNAFNQINIEKSRAEYDEASVDYKDGKISKDDFKAKSDAYIKELTTRKKKEEEVYAGAVSDLASKRGVDADALMQIFQGSNEDYEAAKAVMPRQEKHIKFADDREIVEYKDINRSLWTDAEKIGDVLRKMSNEDLQKVQSLGTASIRTQGEITRVEKETFGITGAGNGTAKGGLSAAPAVEKATKYEEGSIGDIDAQIAAAKEALISAVIGAERIAIQERINALQKEREAMLDGAVASVSQHITVTPTLAEDAAEILNAEIAEMSANLEKIKVNIDANTTGNPANVAEDTAIAWQTAGQAIGAVSGAIAGLEDPTAKIAGIIGQAIATMALSYASAAQIAAVTGGPWGWIAFAATGLATLITTVVSIKSLVGSYADGGIIPGNSPSGDLLTANVNSGELILNRAQQASIASQLTASSAVGNLSLTSTIRGEDIRLVLSNNSRRRGGVQGEYAISR